MKKTEIIQLILIVLGIMLLFNIVTNLSHQLLLLRNQDYYPTDFILSILIAALLFITTGYLLIIKSRSFARKIIKEDHDREVNLNINKPEFLQFSILIISIVLLVNQFIPFFSTLVQMLVYFVDDFNYFKELLPTQIATVFLYLILIYIFYNSKTMAHWMNARFFNKE